MTTTNQFYITSQPLALVSSGNNASVPGSFSANAITAPMANLSSITANALTANTVVGQTATFSGNVSTNTDVLGQRLGELPRRQRPRHHRPRASRTRRRT